MRQKELAMANILRQLAEGEDDPCRQLFCLYWIARSSQNRVYVTPGTVDGLVAFSCHLVLMDAASAVSIVSDTAAKSIRTVVEECGIPPIKINCGWLTDAFEEMAVHCLSCPTEAQERVRVAALIAHVGREMQKSGGVK